MSKFGWYWNRLRAMTPAEVVLHLRRRVRQIVDARHVPRGRGVKREGGRHYPALPAPASAPPELREALADDRRGILEGHWPAFGQLDLLVDDPPRWQKDSLAGCDLTTERCAFELDHRRLPEGADSKLIWELSRWHAIARLAMAAHVLNDPPAASKCLAWLEDWVRGNVPYRGWNWTSALEAGIRLIQFAWLEALLERFVDADRWCAVRSAILPAHVRFVWRHRSFGSSANNHLLGELAGLVVANVRWPSSGRWTGGLDRLQRLWEAEVIAQFADDGGNREQALHYQLFAFELCWQARLALRSLGRRIAESVEERLYHALDFFREVQSSHDEWDYGDSDGAFVTPVFIHSDRLVQEWRDWASKDGGPGGIHYWLGSRPDGRSPVGKSPGSEVMECGHWRRYADSGIAVCESGNWWLRWDLSPLGYLSTAAHGHLDALHVSIWLHGVAIVIDPGTGAYYADTILRSWLASRAAHNGPWSEQDDWPVRQGPFLWSNHHPQPQVSTTASGGLLGTVAVGNRMPSREIRLSEDHREIVVEDSLGIKGVPPPEMDFQVHWQFAPGATFEHRNERSCVLRRGDVAVLIELSDDWSEVELVETPPVPSHGQFPPGTVSPGFRKVDWAPYLRLRARGRMDEPCVFRTSFLASPPS
jgi:hypothetical protein